MRKIKKKKKDSDAYRSAKRVRCAQNQAKERQKQDHNFAGFRFQHARSRWEFRLNQRIWLRLSSVFESRRISFFQDISCYYQFKPTVLAMEVVEKN